VRDWAKGTGNAERPVLEGIPINMLGFEDIFTPLPVFSL